MTVVPKREAYEQRKAIRVDRQSNRGRVIISTPGLNTVRRREAFDQAINFNALTGGVTVQLIRERIRKGWTLKEAISTSA